MDKLMIVSILSNIIQQILCKSLKKLEESIGNPPVSLTTLQNYIIWMIEQLLTKKLNAMPLLEIVKKLKLPESIM